MDAMEYRNLVHRIVNLGNVFIAGSFPAYLYALESGVFNQMPDGVDIDVYVYGSSYDECMSIYEELLSKIPTVDFIRINLERPQDYGFYKTWCRHPYEMISQFDISVARLYIDKDMEYKYIIGEDPLGDIRRKTIRIVHFTNPIKETYRIMKYISRGWNIEKSDIIKLFLAFENMDGDARRKAYDDIIARWK